MNQNQSLQNAVEDLTVIRRAIEKAHSPSLIPTSRDAIEAGSVVQWLCLLITCFLIGFELISDRSMTTIMMLSAQEQQLGVLGLVGVAITLPALVMCTYFITWRAARRSEQSFQDYLARNFQYLRNLSLVSDLLTKFIPLSFLILGGHPEWISCLLSLYVADYLLQGRIFTLPVKVALALGVVSIGLAGVQFWLHSSQLIWPLLHFAIVTIVSLAFLVRARAKS